MKKRDLIKITVSIHMALSFLGCGSSNSGSDPVLEPSFNLTGVYRTSGDLTEISSVTSVEVIEGDSDSDLQVEVLRNGLSFNERVYFNSLNEFEFADSRFGRVLKFKNQKEGLSVKKQVVAGRSFVDVCSDKVSLDSNSMDFQYCIHFLRDEDSLKASGELSLLIYEFGSLVHEIKTPFEVFIKDRWFVDYFGLWSGELSYKNGNALGLRMESGQRLDLVFQPVSENDYILRPYDQNQVIWLYSEPFVLQPVTRPMEELEGNAHPYIDFIYVSAEDGSREVHFKSFVHSDGYIEGVIQLRVFAGNPVILGTYSLEQL